MNFPKDLRYTKTHEWIKRDGNCLTVGISDHAQKEISDIVFVELPKIDQAVAEAKPAAVVESVKAAFDIYAPASGKVTSVNPDLESNPGIVNQDPYGRGWFFRMEPENLSTWDSLLSAEDYEKMLKQEVK